MRNIAILTIALGAAAFGSATESRYLEYRATTSLPNGPVRMSLLLTQDGLWVVSEDKRVREQHLELGSRALQMTRSVRDTGFVAYLRPAGLNGIQHMPYLPGVLPASRKQDETKVFAMIGGGSVQKITENTFNMPILEREETADSLRVRAQLDPMVWAEIEQSGRRAFGDWTIPTKSIERYSDGRGEFSYEWQLVKAVEGDECPKLPTFEEFLSPETLVQDHRTEKHFGFVFQEGRGTFEEQYAYGQEVDRKIEEFERAERGNNWLAAAIAGGLTLGAGALIFRRYRRGTT